MNPAERGQLVAALLRVPGVAAARVDGDDDGPGTLRLDLMSGADEVNVASEVNAVLRDRFGLSVDPDGVRVLSGGTAAAPAERAGGESGPEAPAPRRTRGAGFPLVQPDGDDGESAPTQGKAPEGNASTAPSTGPAAHTDARVEQARPAEADPGRLTIERLRLSSAGLVTTVSVTLSRHGQRYEGAAEGTATLESLNRAVATATLRAVESVATGAVKFELEHVEIAHTPGEQTALAVVTMVTERGTQRLTGASVVREDARQAVIRAVLAAVNRQVPTVLPAAPA